MDQQKHKMAKVSNMAVKLLFRVCFMLAVGLSTPPAYSQSTPPEEGLRAEMAQEWQRAVSIYERVLKTEPGRADLWKRIADIKIHLKDPDGAIEALEKAAEIQPHNAALNSKLATLLGMQHQPERALRFAQKARDAEPGNTAYLQAHARLANWLKRFSEAAESYERLYAMQPDDELALRNLANSWSWANRHDKAIRVYEEFLARHPRNVEIWLALSREKTRQGDQQGALSALSKAARLRPDDAQISAELSRLYSMNNQPEKALEYARHATKSEPGNIAYLQAHAQIANWLKRPAEAVVSLEKIVALRPDDDEARRTLADTYRWAGEGRKATALYEAYLNENPQDLKLWLTVADSKVGQGDVRGAAALLEKAFEKFIPAAIKPKRVRQKEERKLPVLLYHCIGDKADNDYWLSASEFDAQMKQLKEMGYQSITSRNLEDYLFDQGRLPDKAVMITFDDACANLYTHAWPILKKYGFVADIYIFTGAIRHTGADRASIVQHVNGKDTRLEYLIWPEIKEMIGEGLVIGAHSKTHADMATLTPDELKYEILASKLRIFAETGVVATSFSYPFGSGYNRTEAHRLLRSAGFDIAFSAHGGVEHLRFIEPMKIKRVEIWGPHPKIDPGSRGVSVVPDPFRPYDLFRNRLNPDEAGVHYEQARLYAAVQEKRLAYEEIEKALSLEPGSRRYLRFMTQLADWNNRGQLSAAMAGFNKLQVLGEQDDELLLSQARMLSYAGKMDASERLYAAYLRSRPDDKDVLIEHVKVQSWRGNVGRAVQLLSDYRHRFGEDDSWRETKMEVLSWANRPQETRNLIEPIIEKKPDDYRANFAHALSLHFGNEPRKALDALKEVEQRFPGAGGNPLLTKIITDPHRPEVEGSVAYVSSSEELDALSSRVQGNYSLNPETRVSLGYVNERFTAQAGSGLENIDGSENAGYWSILLGLRHRFSPRFSGDLHLGQASAEGESLLVSKAGVDIEPLDSVDVRLEYSRDYFHDYYSSSPRTISLGIEADRSRLSLNWRPGFNYHILARGGYSEFSDGNSSRDFSFAVRRAIARTQHWNTDFGFSAALLDFSRERDNGYYDPDNYQRYMVSGTGYWKAGDKGGVNISLAIGAAKDDTMDGFKFASEAGINGKYDFGTDWLFGFGISGVHNVTRGGGAYTGNGVNVSVVRRF